MNSRFTIDNSGAEVAKARYPTIDSTDDDGPNCPAGTRVLSKRCVPCPPGSYSATENSPRCIKCQGNTIAASSGSTTCIRCPTGYTAYLHTQCKPPAPTRAPTRKIPQITPLQRPSIYILPVVYAPIGRPTYIVPPIQETIPIDFPKIPK
jgi:Tyrosine-protein kinase ephrin type A/B receptor-like